MNIINELERFLLTEITKDMDQHIKSIASDENLISRGIIDSMGILKLVSFVENKFGIKIGDEDITPENFQSLNSLKTLIENKHKN